MLSVPEFYNTAWTLKLLRGLALWVVCAIIAWPVAHFYNSPILAWVLPVAALYFVFEGFSSISPYLMQRRLRVRDLSVLSLVYEFIQDAALVVLAVFLPLDMAPGARAGHRLGRQDGDQLFPFAGRPAEILHLEAIRAADPAIRTLDRRFVHHLFPVDEF